MHGTAGDGRPGAAPTDVLGAAHHGRGRVHRGWLARRCPGEVAPSPPPAGRTAPRVAGPARHALFSLPRRPPRGLRHHVRSQLMIAADERLDRALRLADPGSIATPTVPSVDDEVRAALAWADQHPGTSAPADRHRRLLTSTVAVAALAAAAVLIIPLMTPGSSPLGAPYAAAADLHE